MSPCGGGCACGAGRCRLLPLATPLFHAPPATQQPQINRFFPSRASRRLLHGMAMFAGVVLAAIAFLIRFVATQRSPGSTHLPQPDDPLWLKIHVYLGYAVLLGAAAMTFVGASACARARRTSPACALPRSAPHCRLLPPSCCTTCRRRAHTPAGFYKFVVRTRENLAVMRWHGHVGLAVWMAGLLNVSVAVYGYFYGVSGHSWIAFAAWAGLGAVIVTSVATIFADPERAQAAGDEPYTPGYGKLAAEDESMAGGSLYDSPAGRGSMNGRLHA